MSTDQAHGSPETPDSHEDPAVISKHAYEHLYENIHFFSGFFALSLVAVTFSSYMFSLTPVGNLRVTLFLLTVRSGLILYFFYTMLKFYPIAYRTIIFTIFFLFCMIGLFIFADWDFLGIDR
jgi:hypothetical protein